MGKYEKNYVSDNSKLMEEWDFVKNALEGLQPEQLQTGSGISVWWICKNCGNSFKARISSRKKAKGCSKCLIEV